MYLAREKRSAGVAVDPVKYHWQRCLVSVSVVEPKRYFRELPPTPDIETRYFYMSNVKQCSKCKQVKLVTEFWRKSSDSSGYRSQCKDCRRQYREANARKIAEYKREWEKRNPSYRTEWRNANRQKYQAYWRKGYRKYYRNNQAKERDRIRTWRQANPEKAAEWDQNRRARKQAAQGSFTSEQFIELCQEYDNRCLCCGEQEKLTVDHIQPISCGGSNSIENIQPLCGSCNSRKGTQTIDFRRG